MRRSSLIISLVSLGIAPAVASAAPAHHRHRHAAVAAQAYERRVQPTGEDVAHTSQEPLEREGYNPYANYTGPGSAVLNATVRAAREPGVTLELAPDAKETATGGPVGGPPGFDGS